MTMTFSEGKSQWPPKPGLDGTYRDTCIVCMRATDTQLAFDGSAEWLMAGLMVLGIPEGEASPIALRAPGDDPEHLVIQVRVCPRCVARCKAPFPAPRVLMEGSTIPCIARKPRPGVAT
jgi:hypothetical protein